MNKNKLLFFLHRKPLHIMLQILRRAVPKMNMQTGRQTNTTYFPLFTHFIHADQRTYKLTSIFGVCT
jgi:hypothetical protein